MELHYRPGPQTLLTARSWLFHCSFLQASCGAWLSELHEPKTEGTQGKIETITCLQGFSGTKSTFSQAFKFNSFKYKDLVEKHAWT